MPCFGHVATHWVPFPIFPLDSLQTGVGRFTSAISLKNNSPTVHFADYSSFTLLFKCKSYYLKTQVIIKMLKFQEHVFIKLIFF